MADFWAIREGMQLRPFGAESADAFGKVPFGKVVHVEVKQPRNGPHHRLYWTLCQRIGNAVGCEADSISDLLKVRTGHVHTVHTKRGIEKFPKSISYAKMDQTAFKDFFDRCVVVIGEEFGIAKPDILAVMDDLLNEKAA